MRAFLIIAALAAGLPALGGCTTSSSNNAIQEMNNPANACGPGGTSNVNECQSSGGGRR